MPRPKTYVREEVLGAATQLFWAKGYAGTSMRDLVDKTGLHRRSMYEAFGDKDGLFRACLDTYVARSTHELGTLLRQQPQGLHNIEAFFRNRMDYVASGRCKGCLLVNTVIEQELVDEAASRQARLYLRAMENDFYSCLRAAQEKGEISQQKDCEVLARYLMCFLEGLMVMGKTHPSKRAVEAVLETVLATITH